MIVRSRAPILSGCPVPDACSAPDQIAMLSPSLWDDRVIALPAARIV